MRFLITGGAGFIGSNFTHSVADGKNDVIVLDLFTYAGNPENLLPVKDKIRVIKGDICDEKLVDEIFKEKIDVVVHFAAESHVDRSIYSPQSFIRTNIFGTYVLLNSALKHGVGIFIYISTDEVYGSVRVKAKETTRFNPSSPYSASKCSADLLAQTFFKLYSLPVIIIRPSNNYGPYQYPEKFIPLVITNAFEDKPIPIYGDGKQKRDWIYVSDCVEGIMRVIEVGKVGEIYNLSTERIYENIYVARKILEILGKPFSLIRHIEDRPAHDRKYATSSQKVRKLGWKPKYSLEEGLRTTIKWYRENLDWWRKIKKSEEFILHKERVYKGLF